MTIVFGHVSHSRTVEIGGKKLRLRSVNRHNPAGYYVHIAGQRLFFAVLRREEAEARAIEKIQRTYPEDYHVTDEGERIFIPRPRQS